MSLPSLSADDRDGSTSGNQLRLASNSNKISSKSSVSGRDPFLQLFIKRIFDIVVSSVALVLLVPAFFLIAAAVRLESCGPALFRQKRWGKDNSIIEIYKFRSMRSDLGDETGVAQTVHNDIRVTRIGRFLRKTNLDELPQLLNVLKGDMSLVGPRCHAIGMTAAGRLYEDLVPHYHQRHAMRPGITGLAQARGLRGPTYSASKARARVSCDIYYIENFSIMLDLLIMFWTIKSEIRGGNGF